jgi:hypothetical protein
MNQDNPTTACPRCQSINLPGVKFCAQCGSRLTTLAVGVPVTAVQIDPMARVREALHRGNAHVTGGDGQSTLDYQLTFSDRLLSGFMKLQFAGTVAIQTGGNPGYSVTARMLPRSVAMQFGLLVAGAVVLGFIPQSIVPNEMFVGAVAIALGLTVWITFAEAPRRVRRHVATLINLPLVAAPASATVSSGASITVNAVEGGDVFAQLERLAQMQATGLLTAEEVAAKKAELLKRI